jgi:hypothetical protein
MVLEVISANRMKQIAAADTPNEEIMQANLMLAITGRGKSFI